jgi:ubiquinol-cytochrome c reductase cytochrome c subunit
MSGMETVSTPDATAGTPLGRTRRRRIAKLVLLIVGLGTMGLLYSGLQPARSAAANSNPAIVRGRALFEQGCASCHGLNAQGGTTAPSLIGVGAAAADFQVATGRMPLQQHGAQAPAKRNKYTDAQTEELAAFVASLAPGPAIPTNLNYQSADVAFGGAFRTNCAQCHNFAGSGGALTGGKYAPSLSSATPKDIYEAMITGPESMPVFGNQQITAAQKLAIIKYIRTIKAEPNPGGAGLGRVGPVSETVVAWLVGIVGLVIITMWIGSKA